jgi:hypothetical protein
MCFRCKRTGEKKCDGHCGLCPEESEEANAISISKIEVR